MNEQIIKLEADPHDQGCLQITLRHPPRRFNFWRNKQVNHQSRDVIYKGYGDHWYRLPSFKPAPGHILPLLKAISYGPQFKHLRYNIPDAKHIHDNHSSRCLR